MQAEYDSLSSADQSYWENMSELEVIAKSGNAPSPSPSVQPQACSVEEVAVSTLAVVPTETACYSETGVLSKTGVPTPRNQSSVDDVVYPVDPESIRVGIAAAGGINQMCAKVEASANRKPMASRRSVPKKLNSHCSSVCVHRSRFQQVSIKDQLVSWSKKEFLRVRALNEHTPLYAIDADLDDGDLMCFQLGCGKSHSGHNPARPNWILHEASDGSTCSKASCSWITGQGFRLRASLGPHVASTHDLARQPPYDCVSCGPLQVLSEVQFAESVAMKLLPSVSEVTLVKFLFELDDDDDTLNGIITRGYDPLFAPFTICESISLVSLEDADASSPPMLALGDIDYLDAIPMLDHCDGDDDKLDEFDNEVQAMLSPGSFSALLDICDQMPPEPEGDVVPSSPPTSLASLAAVRPPTLTDGLDYRRACAMAIPKSASKDELYALLAIDVTPQWRIVDTSKPTRPIIGTVRPIQMHLLQMACSRHKNGKKPCNLVLLSEGRPFEVELELIKWLVAGHYCDTQESHYDMSARLRAEYNTAKK